MSDAEQINLLLHRNLDSGKEFEKLIPEPTGDDFFIEEKDEFSDTYDTIESIANCVEDYAFQYEKVAEVLKGNNVLETIENNYWFLYWHHQYKIDEKLTNQKLCSPSYAWKHRKIGFDCKTFSLLASCLLVNQGIEHSIRKVKLSEAEGWSHVYVVIPFNGKDYVIDATKHTNTEVGPIIEKYDYDMSKYLKHHVLGNPLVGYLDIDSPEQPFLACPSTNCGCANTGLSNPYSSLNGDEQTSFLGIDFSSWNLGSLSCWGGAFDSNTFNSHLAEVTNFYKNEINNLNNAVVNNNPAGVQKAVNRIMQQALMNAHYSNLAAGYWWSSQCTIESVNAFNQASNYFLQLFRKTLINSWLTEYFTFSKYTRLSSTIEMYTTNYYPNDQFVIFIDTTQYKNVEFKENLSEIKAFQFTPYSNQTAFTTSFSPVKYIDSLQNVLVSYAGNDTDYNGGSNEYDASGGGNSNGSGSGGGNSKIPLAVKVLGGAALIWGGAKLFNKIKSNKNA